MAKILLVEDYENIRKVYQIALTEEGYQVDTAASGAEALKQVAATTYALIILDMVMLQYSGMEFLEAFRTQQPQPPTKVIVLSNIDSPGIIQRAMALGVMKYLIKSHYTPKQLVGVVQEVLSAPPAPGPVTETPQP